MSREEIREKLKEIVLQTVDMNRELVDGCSEDSDLRTDLGLSSVGLLYMVMVVEETFGIVFENVGINDFHKLKDVIDYLEKNMKK